MITIEMNEIGFICWAIIMVFPSLLVAICLFIGLIQDFKNSKKKLTEEQRKAQILKDFMEWYDNRKEN